MCQGSYHVQLPLRKFFIGGQAVGITHVGKMSPILNEGPAYAASASNIENFPTAPPLSVLGLSSSGVSLSGTYSVSMTVTQPSVNSVPEL